MTHDANDAPWAIVTDGGISDRYTTADEAVADLDHHPAGCRVIYAPEPDIFTDWGLSRDGEGETNDA